MDASQTSVSSRRISSLSGNHSDDSHQPAQGSDVAEPSSLDRGSSGSTNSGSNALQSPRSRSHSPNPSAIGGFESTVRFLLLPSQVFVVLLLEFLNSFRSFGLRFVLYNYITNEYGIGDTKAGSLLGIKGFVDIAFGLVGSILVDIVGVRAVAIFALSVAIVGRSLLAFGRTTTTLYLALFLFSPCGDALLGVGLYRVALKKLTTPLTRPLAFAVSYAMSNLSGALADIIVDHMRKGFDDFVGFGGVYTPTRQFIVSLILTALVPEFPTHTDILMASSGNCGEKVVTWIVVLITFIVAYCFLEDWTVIDPVDLDDDNSFEADNKITTELPESKIPPDAIPAKPMVPPRLLKKWFPNNYRLVHSLEDDVNPHQKADLDDDPSSVRCLTPNYKMYRTRYANENDASGNNHYQPPSSILFAPCRGILQIINQVIALLRIRNTWRVLVFGFASFTVATQWAASEIVLPPFLERRFGESIPIYTIQSINLFGCLILPPIIGAFFTGCEDFQIVMPGLWIMATSPIFVALSPNVVGSCAWQVFMTVGEVFWSPRQDSWTAGLAPTGMEGLFFAVGSARSLLVPMGDVVLGRMNEKYNTNCPGCRDQYGHFCENLVKENGDLQCSSVQETCDLFLTNPQQSCPKTCLECPSWEATDPSTFWYLLIMFSIASPVLVWFFLPFLRGQHRRGDRCYGVCSISINRVLGLCGARDNSTHHQRLRVDDHKIYGHIVESENFESESEERKIEVEIT